MGTGIFLEMGLDRPTQQIVPFSDEGVHRYIETLAEVRCGVPFGLKSDIA